MALKGSGGNGLRGHTAFFLHSRVRTRESEEALRAGPALMRHQPCICMGLPGTCPGGTPEKGLHVMTFMMSQCQLVPMKFPYLPLPAQYYPPFPLGLFPAVTSLGDGVLAMTDGAMGL